MKTMRTLQMRTTISIMSYWGKFSILFAVLFAVISACEAPKEIGLPPSVVLSVIYTDTLTVKTSTVLLDSVRTSTASQMLAGSYNDPQFGKVSANSYFEYGGVLNLDNNKVYQYDSVALSMTYSYIQGDTTQPFTLNVHRLKDTLDNKTYYNYSSVAYDPKPFVSATFRPAPSQNNTVRVALPEAYGRSIFGSYAAGVTTLQQFVSRFKGFALIPNANNKAIIGFPAVGIQVQLYYHEFGSPLQSGVAIRPTNRRFNQVQSQKSGTVLANLKPLKPISSQQLGGYSYVQDALGIVTKIEIPNLKNLSKDGPIAFNRAELFIKPDLNFPPNGIFRIPELVLAETDETNRVLRSKGDLELLLSDDAAVYSGQISPQISQFSARFQQYDFVLTNYLEAINSGFKKSKGLLLMPLDLNEFASLGAAPTKFTPYLNSKVSRLIIQPNAENMKLVVFYTKAK